MPVNVYLYGTYMLFFQILKKVKNIFINVNVNTHHLNLIGHPVVQLENKNADKSVIVPFTL